MNTDEEAIGQLSLVIRQALMTIGRVANNK
jgi:hypothetical protein